MKKRILMLLMVALVMTAMLAASAASAFAALPIEKKAAISLHACLESRLNAHPFDTPCQ